MQTGFSFQSHPSEDLLEEYAFRRLTEDQIAPLEEHLLLCSECQQAVSEIDEYMLLMKTATARLAASSAQQRKERAARLPARLRQFASQLSVWRGLAWGAAGALACVAAGVYLASRTPTAPVAVALASFRGGEDKVSHVPSRSPLLLQINPTDWPPASSYRVEVVTASGKRVWTGEPRLHNEKLEASVSSGLNKGVHWVRLYDAVSADLLGEFPLRVD